MADNDSLIGGKVSVQHSSGKVIILQFFVILFLSINSLLSITFFKKKCFYTTVRYILFAVTLLSDSLILIMSNILLILTFLQITLQVVLCVIICVVICTYVTLTPVTLTVMSLERYVAICMPLRHAALCSRHRIMHCILIIHGVSSVPSIILFFSFLASASLSLYKQHRICSVEMLIVYGWQDHIRSASRQFYFLIMCIIIVFCYVKIIKVAKAASGQDKKSTQKGLRTVILHAFQLLLCLIQLWCPFIETAVLQINIRLFADIRYFNYILFCLAPRCLSPLIYGLRDERFLLELKSYVFFGLYRKKNTTN